jgi:hypothetical protein
MFDVRGVVDDLSDEQVSPTQILVLPAVPLPGGDGDHGRPDSSDDTSFRDRAFRRRHLLSSTPFT